MILPEAARSGRHVGLIDLRAHEQIGERLAVDVDRDAVGMLSYFDLGAQWQRGRQEKT